MIGGVLMIVVALASALWWQIDRNATLRAKLETCNSIITRSEDFNAATSNPDNLSWIERLSPGTSAAD
jgi:hypothetical protein